MKLETIKKNIRDSHTDEKNKIYLLHRVNLANPQWDYSDNLDTAINEAIHDADINEFKFRHAREINVAKKLKNKLKN